MIGSDSDLFNNKGRKICFERGDWFPCLALLHSHSAIASQWVYLLQACVLKKLNTDVEKLKKESLKTNDVNDTETDALWLHRWSRAFYTILSFILCEEVANVLSSLMSASDDYAIRLPHRNKLDADVCAPPSWLNLTLQLIIEWEELMNEVLSFQSHKGRECWKEIIEVERGSV